MLGYEQCVDWIAEEIGRFLDVADDELGRPVPSCPGWDVAAVFDHLGRGAGIGWRTWFSEPAEIDGMAVLMNLPARETGVAAKTRFGVEMPAYVEVLRATAPDKPCFWFAGPVPASWLVLLGANEIATHRADVAMALGFDGTLSGPRAADAFAITAEFIPQLRSRRRAGEAPPAALRVVPSDIGQEAVLGAGPPAVTVHGTASDLRLALWGRPTVGELRVDGDRSVFNDWGSTAEGPGPIG